jgi:HSP20 family protein
MALLNVVSGARPSGRLWNPPADIYRCQDGWLVKVDVAGVTTDDIEILIDDTKLRIRGCRRDTHYREGFSYQQMEITYSRFEKVLEFPCPIEDASISRDYRDGFLIIKLTCR